MRKLTKKRLIRNITALLFLIIVIFLIKDKFLNKDTQMKDVKYEKILLIGIDGMDPKITDKLISEGKLPNFKRLKEQGAYTNLGTSLPPHSPVAWTSITTGTNPGKHNIFDFIRINKERQLPELSLAKSKSGISGTDYEPYVKSDTFWKITSEAGIPTTILRWPMSFPPERIEGNLLAGLGVPDIKGLLSGYTFYTTSDFDRNAENSKKTVAVENLGSIIKTSISGPNVRKGGDITSVNVPLKIEFDKDSAVITVQESEYPVKAGGWSNWIRIKFKVGLFKNVYGICKAYLVSTGPEFNMYITDVQIDPENPLVSISYPEKYSKELAKKIGLYNTLGIPEDTNALIDGKITDETFLEQCEQIEEERDKMFLEEFEKFDKGILAIVYDTSDRIQHTHWDDKNLEDDGKLSVNQAIIDYYIKKDEFLGKVLNQIDDKTALIVLSDHGFTSFEKNVDINSWLSKNDFMTLTRQPGENNYGELFEFVDWSQTKAYSLGFNSIYINIKDRENKGAVDESERERIMDEIIQKLEELTDTETKKKVIAHVYKREDVYYGGYVEEGPDLIIGFNPGYRMSWQTAVGGVTSEIVFDNKKVWNGDHLVDPSFVPGVLFTNFKINNKNPSQIDIAPTILKLAGLGIPEEMDGKSLL